MVSGYLSPGERAWQLVHPEDRGSLGTQGLHDLRVLGGLDGRDEAPDTTGTRHIRPRGGGREEGRKRSRVS